MIAAILNGITINPFTIPGKKDLRVGISNIYKIKFGRYHNYTHKIYSIRKTPGFCHRFTITIDQ